MYVSSMDLRSGIISVGVVAWTTKKELVLCWQHCKTRAVYSLYLESTQNLKTVAGQGGEMQPMDEQVIAGLVCTT